MTCRSGLPGVFGDILPCLRCRTPWPRWRMTRIYDRTLCEICVLVVIWPWPTIKRWRQRRARLGLGRLW